MYSPLWLILTVILEFPFPMHLQQHRMYTPVSQNVEFSQPGSLRKRPSVDKKPVQWQITMWTPGIMLGLFLSGILICAGHHLFYSRLDGTIVRDSGEVSQFLTQVWIIRYGTAFAFLAKTLLAGAVVVAYKQEIWIDLRRRTNSVATIDALFAATHDLTALLDARFFLRAWLPLLLAITAWLLPFAALITPSTLTVSLALNETWYFEHVPTINFNDTSLYFFPGLGDNTSPALGRITTATATNMGILPMSAIGTNTTYRHTFMGPSYKCEPLESGSSLQNLSAIRNATMTLSGAKTLVYLAYTVQDFDLTHLNASTIASNCVVSNKYGSCDSSDRGTTYMSVGNETLQCSMHDTLFDLTMQAVGNTQSIQSLQFDWLSQYNWTKAHPSNKTDWNRHEAYSYMLQALSTLLDGAIGLHQEGSTGSQSSSLSISMQTYKTRVMSTSLVGKVSTGQKVNGLGPLRALPIQEQQLASNRTLAEMVEELSRNQTLSLFSNEMFWLPPNATDTTPVNHTSIYNKYEYRPRNLAITYGIAIAFSMCGVLLGLRAMFLNGICHDTSFSSIMSTTRNRYLDDLTLGYSLGSTPVPNAIKNVKLRFGELKASDLSADGSYGTRAAFGREDNISTLNKGQQMY